MESRSDSRISRTEACAPMALLPIGRSRLRWMVSVLPFLVSCTAAPTLDEQHERTTPSSHRGVIRGVEDLEVVSLSETWVHDRDRLDVSLLLPQSPGRSPLILYMGGRGRGSWIFLAASLGPGRLCGLEPSARGGQPGAGVPGSGCRCCRPSI
jgi:hypothetical protein